MLKTWNMIPVVVVVVIVIIIIIRNMAMAGKMFKYSIHARNVPNDLHVLI